VFEPEPDCHLFERDKSVISRHLRAVFETGELERESTVAKNATVQTEGDRKVVRTIETMRIPGGFGGPADQT
jgi:hypothetical protein